MKILLISDTHGKTHALENIILPAHAPEVDLVIHLGDFVRDLFQLQPKYPNLQMLGVGGSFEQDNEIKILDVCGKKIYYVHGHDHDVKNKTSRLEFSARIREVDACFFGHSHKPVMFSEDGIFYMNPGSVSEGRGNPIGYGIVTISDSGQFSGELIEL